MARFIEGKTYSNFPASKYGTNKSTTTPNVQVAAEPVMTKVATRVTKTYATFADVTLHYPQRFKIYSDALGSFVYPKGRFPGAPIFRA